MRRQVIYMLATVILSGAAHATPVVSLSLNEGLMMHGNNDGVLPDRVVVTIDNLDVRVPQIIPPVPGSSPNDDLSLADIAKLGLGTRWVPAGGSIASENTLPAAPTTAIPEPGTAAPLLIAFGWLLRRRNAAR